MRRGAGRATVDTLWRLSADGVAQRRRAVGVISWVLIVGGGAAMTLMAAVPPTAHADAAEAFVAAVIVAGVVSVLSGRQLGDRYPAWLFHSVIALTAVTTFVGSAAYPHSDMGIALLAYFVWGAVNLFTMLSWREAAAHHVMRIPMILAVPWLDRVQHPQAVGVVVAVMALSAGVSAGIAAADNRRHGLVDPLTQCPNRTALNLLLAHEMARLDRSEHPLTVAVVDLDHFKEINDKDGHDAGDRALRAVAAEWASHLRRSDIVARVGGDEFVVVLPDCPADQADAILDRLVRPAGYSCSVGAVAADPDETVERLLRRADAAMYRAKHDGRGRVVRLDADGAAA